MPTRPPDISRLSDHLDEPDDRRWTSVILELVAIGAPAAAPSLAGKGFRYEMWRIPSVPIHAPCHAFDHAGSPTGMPSDRSALGPASPRVMRGAESRAFRPLRSIPGRRGRGCRWSAMTIALLVLPLTLHSLAAVGSEAETQTRVTRDAAAGRPIVVHVVVALCDNVNQGIVRVPASLGNGQNSASNLYWGAAYGVCTYLEGHGGWMRVPVEQPPDTRIRERAVFFNSVRRDGKVASVYVVADAWDGAEIRSAIERFLEMASGGAAEKITVPRVPAVETIVAGGSAHLVAFVGHNGLMDFSIDGPMRRADEAGAGSSVVLACASKPYFLDRLRLVGSHPLLLTTGLMAPEAYTLEAAIRSWAAGDGVAATREAAASAYSRYQHCGLRSARNLFWGES